MRINASLGAYALPTGYPLYSPLSPRIHGAISRGGRGRAFCELLRLRVGVGGGLSADGDVVQQWCGSRGA